MTILDQPMMLIKGIARLANCHEMPAVRIVFDTPGDQTKFKFELVKHMKAADAVTAPIASKGGIDSFEVTGVQIELSNRDRGTRASVEKLIKVAEKALDDARKQRITQAEIIELRRALSDLIDLVRG